jgi:pyruvate/2-oxoglutarate dehydrogenase complex dihydrolipoamide acyltransferase (E2) component
MSRHEFLMPDVGEGLDKGVILAWRVAAGDSVSADQIIAEIETDKAIVEIPAPVTGTVLALGGEPGTTIAVGDVLAVFESPSGGDHEKTTTSDSVISDQAQPSAPQPENDASKPAVQDRPARVRASPATRKLATSLGLNLADIDATGSRGQVTRADVERASAHEARGDDARRTPTLTQAVAYPPTERPDAAGAGPSANRRAAIREREERVEPLSGLRRQIARNMEQAWREVPHIFSLEQIEATGLVSARREINLELEKSGQRLSYMPFFIKACCAALIAHPRFNASLDLDNDRIIYHGTINVGIATATPEGLIVTVVHDADRKSFIEIGSELEALSALARERRVTVDQIRGATFTISNYGSYGAWMGTPIIRPPEVAIAGFGRIHEAVIPVDGHPAVRTMLPLVVSTDHRLNDGEHLGQFMDSMTSYLRAPVRLLGSQAWS